MENVLNISSRYIENNDINNSQGLLQMNKNSAGKLPSQNSLAMLKMLENFRLSAQRTSKEGKMISSKKRKAPKNDDTMDLARHDGLLVDYSKFSDLTKEVLKNANVMR